MHRKWIELHRTVSASVAKKSLQPQDDGQAPAIEIQFTTDATKKLFDFSRENIGQRMQIVWTDIILSDAVVQTALPGKLLIMLNGDNSVAQEIVSSLQ